MPDAASPSLAKDDLDRFDDRGWLVWRQEQPSEQVAIEPNSGIAPAI
jgi:hypothetical protein